MVVVMVVWLSCSPVSRFRCPIYPMILLSVSISPLRLWSPLWAAVLRRLSHLLSSIATWGFLWCHTIRSLICLASDLLSSALPFFLSLYGWNGTGHEFCQKKGIVNGMVSEWRKSGGPCRGKCFGPGLGGVSVSIIVTGWDAITISHVCTNLPLTGVYCAVCNLIRVGCWGEDGLVVYGGYCRWLW